VKIYEVKIDEAKIGHQKYFGFLAVLNVGLDGRFLYLCRQGTQTPFSLLLNSGFGQVPL